MAYKNPIVPQISNPVLLDKAIQQVQNSLATLSWADKVFGRSRRAVEVRDGSRFYFPECYMGDGEYYNVLPNDNLDSCIFFDVEDPQDVGDYDPAMGSFSNIEARVGIVVYGNLEKINDTKEYYFSEELKKDVMDILLRGMVGEKPVVFVDSIYEDIDNVFRGYTIKEEKTQLYKHPWFGIRFDCRFIFRETC